MPNTNSQDFFKPIELAVLATHLKKRKLLPRRIRVIDAKAVRPPGAWNEERDGIAPVEGRGFARYDDALSNAVARICLSGIQENLPQWQATDDMGKITLSRKITSPLDMPPRILLPQFLFTINWADSGPGYSWPEAYYATRVPFFDATIVTLSHDTVDVYGYCDLAIGWLKKGHDSEAEIGGIIKRHWKHLFDEGGQQRWAYLFGTGMVDGNTAENWADEIWARDRVPYDLPNESARRFIPSLVGDSAMKVYAASPLFWAIERDAAGKYRARMGTLFGSADRGHRTTPRAIAEFVKHTAHLGKLQELLKVLQWDEITAELEKAILYDQETK